MKKVLIFLCLFAILLCSCAVTGNQENIPVDEKQSTDQKQETPEKCSHSEKENITLTFPTCTNAGMVQVKCKLCGENLGVDYTPAEGHSLVEATCTEAAYCSKCGFVSGKALGHNIVNGKCSRCDFVATGSLSGSLTYQTSIGGQSYPATDARAFLIPNRNLKQYDGGTNWYSPGHYPSGIIVAQSDSLGNYKMEEVPVGEYYLVLSSRKGAYGSLTLGKDVLLKEILGSEDYSDLKILFISSICNCCIKKITINQNENKTINYGF